MHVKLSYTCCIGENMIMHYLNSQFEFEFEPLLQINSNSSIASCINSNHSILTCHDHASYCALHWLCSISVVGGCSLSIDMLQWWDRWHRWRIILSSEVPVKQNPLVHSDTIPFSRSCSLYCIRTTTTHLLLAAVVEPLILCMTCHCHSK